MVSLCIIIYRILAAPLSAHCRSRHATTPMLGAEVMQHAKAAVPVVGHQSAQQMAQLEIGFIGP